MRFLIDLFTWVSYKLGRKPWDDNRRDRSFMRQLPKVIGREDEYSGNLPYLLRWEMWLPFGFRFMVHVIQRTDSSMCLHDHPFSFLTFILAGGYIEITEKEFEIDCGDPAFGDTRTVKELDWNVRAAGDLIWRPAKFKHRIEVPEGGCAVTLIIKNRRHRKWGFFTKDGWVEWMNYKQGEHRC